MKLSEDGDGAATALQWVSSKSQKNKNKMEGGEGCTNSHFSWTQLKKQKKQNKKKTAGLGLFSDKTSSMTDDSAPTCMSPT